MKRNEGLSQAQKPVLQKPVFARGNLAAKVDEKPSLCSDPHKTVVKTGGDGQKVLRVQFLSYCRVFSTKSVQKMKSFRIALKMKLFYDYCP